MIALYIIAAIILLFVILLFIPASIRVVYEEEVTIYALVWFIKFKLIPSTKKIKPITQQKFVSLINKHNKPKKKKQKDNKSEKKEEKPPRFTVSSIMACFDDIVSAIKDILSTFSHFLYIKIYKLHIIVASKEASKTALEYGAITTAVASLLQLLENTSNVQYSDNKPSIDCDYLVDKPTFDIDILFKIRIYQILNLGIKAIISYLFINRKMEAHKKWQNKKLAK